MLMLISEVNIYILTPNEINFMDVWGSIKANPFEQLFFLLAVLA